MVHFECTSYDGHSKILSVNRKQKKSDEIRLMTESESADDNTELTQTNRPQDEGDIFITSLQKSG